MAEKKLVQTLDSIDEYEREPVPENKTKSFRSFVGMVAGEHIAGTEFVIGPMFVAYGVSAMDLFLGLLIGNLLAVFSWTFLCARLAVKTRLTNFFQLEKIAGSRLVLFNNGINVLLFGFVAASMTAVSATAIGVPLDIRMPGLNDLLPTSVGWVLAVISVGVVITVVAMFGYDIVSKFANVCAPWMPLVFVAGAIAVLPQLKVNSFSDFWHVANSKIWTGVPMASMPKFTIWHVAAFSWLCNTNMHLGLNDTTIYRYAKKWQYGFASAFGAFIGHYMAWIASGIMCGAALRNVTPGPIAYNAMGVAGIIAVIVAGWTTANPTLYRAGLAMKVILPRSKRWQTTLIMGSLVTLLACFPGVVTRLMNFIAFYALVAAPVGAVVFADVYLLPKLGLLPDYASRKGLSFSWIVGMTWILSFGICQLMQLAFGIEGLEFFLAVPGWIIALVLYLVFNKLFQDKSLQGGVA